MSNYFLRFSNEYKKIYGITEFDNNWYEYVEYGTTNPATILLQRIGFTRENATYIRGHRDKYILQESEYIPEGIKYYSGKYNESKVLKPYDAIMCNTDMTQEKEIVAKIILVPDIFGESPILSTHHISYLIFDDEIYKVYLCLTTQTKWFHNHIKGFSSGTNVLGLDSDGFKNFRLLIPTNDVLTKFNKIIMDNEKYKSNLITENQELASLRDFLLPMLMNGQVTIE